MDVSIIIGPYVTDFICCSLLGVGAGLSNVHSVHVDMRPHHIGGSTIPDMTYNVFGGT